MGGFFGVVSQNDCVMDLYYGTDYHSHLGTYRGGLCVYDQQQFSRYIHNIQNTQFRSKFDKDITSLQGNMGIGCISDTDDQPLIIGSHHGIYAIVTVGRINNIKELMCDAFHRRTAHFSEMDGNEINQTELVATLINQKETLVDGIRHARQSIHGTCSLLILSKKGVYAARDRLGRIPVLVGENDQGYCISMESCALPNLQYDLTYELGPDEILFINVKGYEQLNPPAEEMKICAFLWIYYGYPASSYEKINVEVVRNRCGRALAAKDDISADLVAGIPDSGSAHALGYSNEKKIPYQRSYVKYTPTWPRSFMPQDQYRRRLVARMKLIPVADLIRDKRILFCEDSIVRGTQLHETIRRLWDYGATQLHMRVACPPLMFACKYLNFSRSKSELDLAARRAIRELEGDDEPDNLYRYYQTGSPQYLSMKDWIRRHFKLTTLKYQTLNDMIAAIGLPQEKICTYCWNRKG